MQSSFNLPSAELIPDRILEGEKMKLTIFTPTYNRAYILGRLYDSLRSQTCKEFEWLIIDDGSTDDTERLVEGWMGKQNTFPIRYYKKENGGKHRAINDALDLAQGKLFLCVDSDDLLTEDAVAQISEWENANDEKTICCIAGNWNYCGAEEENPLFEQTPVIADFFDRYPRKNNHYFFIGHDRAWVFYTDIHRQYKYPEFPGEKFMTEAVAWNRMAQNGYRLLCYNRTIYYCTHQEDGLTYASRENFHKNPYGYGLWVREMTEALARSTWEKVKRYYSFCCELQGEYETEKIADFLKISKMQAVLYLKIHNLLMYLRRKG